VIFKITGSFRKFLPEFFGHIEDRGSLLQLIGFASWASSVRAMQRNVCNWVQSGLEIDGLVRSLT
jgi:hypothetical protein